MRMKKITLLTLAVIFNIAGQRVKDVRSGLYIVNGKKVVVK